MNVIDQMKETFKELNNMTYTNGMATESLEIETEYGILSINRKCGDLEKSEHYHIEITNNHHMGHSYPNVKGIGNKIKTMSILRNTDINIKFKSKYNEDNTHYANIPTDIFKFN